jgi:hypothetical protein
MRGLGIAGLAAFAALAIGSLAQAAVCGSGAYRAGCVGPHGATVAARPPPAPVHCAAGVYRAGCAGPNGAVVTTRPAVVAPRPAVAAPVHCAAGVYRAGCVGPNGAVVAPR